LGFAADRLTGRDPDHALTADVPVGAAPVGLTVVEHGRLIVVADSDRFNAPHQHAALSVVSTSRAVLGRSAVLGSLPAGGFPREMSLDPDGETLLVTNFASGQLEAIDLTPLEKLN
jgi:DNA-binding beta-propeller fold protein YncE